MTGPVIVGFDGSVSSRRAEAWALSEARLLGVPVQLVSCYESPTATVAYGYGGVVPSSLVEDIRAAAEADMKSAVDEAAEHAPDVSVSGHVVEGGVAAALLAQSHDAAMVVLGSRGLGGFRGLLLGSVGQQVSSHAEVPVVVVRGEADRPVSGRVVVAVDGSPASREAVAFAFAYAARHGAALHALHAWEVPVFDAPGVTAPPSLALEEIGDDEVRLTAESLAGWSERFPEVVVTREVVHGPVERLVVEASANADLLVVGSRGRGGFTGLLLGSVSQAALHHSHCPVAVVRPARTTA